MGYLKIYCGWTKWTVALSCKSFNRWLVIVIIEMKNGENIAVFCCLANTKIQSPRQENTVCSVMLVFIFCCSPCVRLAVKQIMNTCWMRWNLCISNVDPCSSAIYKPVHRSRTKPTTNHMIHKFHTFATQPMTIILIVLFENDKMNTFQLTRSVFFFLFFSSIVFFVAFIRFFVCVCLAQSLNFYPNVSGRS